jgi:integrase
MKKTTINTFIMIDGERYCHVINKESGIPLFYPCLYITTILRNNSTSITTIELVGCAISMLYDFLNKNGIKIEERILSREFLKLHEIDALSDYCFWRKKENKVSQHDVKLNVYVDEKTKYFRLSKIASYLEWLCQILIVSVKDELTAVRRFINDIKARRPNAKNFTLTDTRDRSLGKEEMDLILSVIEPSSPQNPFTAEVRQRNQIIILMLYLLGIRSGELLNIKVTDIDFSGSSLFVRRRADDKSDPRVKQPLVKTAERTLPMPKYLSKILYDYISIERRKFTKAKKHNYLLVNHKSGQNQGMPLSIVSYHKIISVLKSVSPELYQLTGHRFRHTWNRELSEHFDTLSEPVSEVEQEKIRTRPMGWKKDSNTAQIYNKRFIEKKTHKTAIELQESLIKGKNK